MNFKLAFIALAAVICSGCVEENYYTQTTQTDMYYTGATPYDTGYRSSHSHQTVVTQTPSAPTVVYGSSHHHNHQRVQSVASVTQTPPAPVDYRSATVRSETVTQTPAAPGDDSDKDKPAVVASSDTDVTSTPQAPE